MVILLLENRGVSCGISLFGKGRHRMNRLGTAERLPCAHKMAPDSYQSQYF